MTEVQHVTFRSISHFWPSNGGGLSHKVSKKSICIICKEEELLASKKRLKSKLVKFNIIDGEPKPKKPMSTLKEFLKKAKAVKETFVNHE